MTIMVPIQLLIMLVAVSATWYMIKSSNLGLWSSHFISRLHLCLKDNYSLT